MANIITGTCSWRKHFLSLQIQRFPSRNNYGTFVILIRWLVHNSLQHLTIMCFQIDGPEYYNLGHKCWKINIFALHTFCLSSPLCNVDLTLFMWQKFVFTIFPTLKGEMGVQEVVFVGFWSWFDVFTYFQHNLSKVVAPILRWCNSKTNS